LSNDPISILIRVLVISFAMASKMNFIKDLISKIESVTVKKFTTAPNKDNAARSDVYIQKNDIKTKI